MSKTSEARAAVAAYATEIAELAARDELDETAEARFAELEGDDGLFAKAEAELERLVKRDETEARARAAVAAGNVEAGDSRSTGPQLMTDSDPFEGLDSIRFADDRKRTAELRSRALKAIDKHAPSSVPDEQREAQTRLMERFRDKGGLAERFLRTGSPQYVEEFQTYLENGSTGPAIAEERATITSSTAGTVDFPWFLDPTLIFTGAGTQNHVREIARVVQLGPDQGNQLNLVTEAQVNAEWIAENSQVADASVAPAGFKINVWKADAHIQLSYEFIQDSVGFVPEITTILADAKDRLEGTAFAVGTGSSQPNGITTALAAVTASRLAAVTQGKFGIQDPTSLVAALPPRFRSNADVAWLANYSVYNLVRGFATSSLGSYFTESLQVDIPAKLLGRPIYQSSDMISAISAATNSADNLLVVGSWHNYVIVDKMGASIKYNDNVMGANLRPVGAVAYTVFWRTGADCPNPAAFQVLRPNRA